MEQIVRTVYGAKLQTAELLGKPIVIESHSSLNEKFNIHANIAVANTDVMSVKYLTIGNGGHRTTVGANGIPLMEPIQHTPRHAALYNHLPFILRLPTDDLIPADRLKYRLRRLETHSGVVYVAYYLRVLDLSATIPLLEFRTVDSGITTSTPFVPTLADLNPTPPAITPGGVLTTTGDYVAATAKVPFTMSSTEIDEFLNVANIIYGDDGYAMITEIGLCSGADRNVVGDFNGVSIGYTDAIGVQIVSFINSFFAVKFLNGHIDVMFDVGSVEPLLVLAAP